MVLVGDTLLLDVVVQLRLDDLSRTVKVIVGDDLIDFVSGQNFISDESSCVGNFNTFSRNIICIKISDN